MDFQGLSGYDTHAVRIILFLYAEILIVCISYLDWLSDFFVMICFVTVKFILV